MTGDLGELGVPVAVAGLGAHPSASPMREVARPGADVGGQVRGRVRMCSSWHAASPWRHVQAGVTQ